jgi:hypothetical protein
LQNSLVYEPKELDVHRIDDNELVELDNHVENLLLDLKEKKKVLNIYC